MRCFTAIVPLVLLATTVGLAIPVNAVDTVSETIRFEYVTPSEALKSVSEGGGSTSSTSEAALPQGMKEITPNDGEKTLVLSGTPSAVAEMKTLLRLFDVKPRLVKVRTRLIEVQTSKDFSQRESVVQSFVFTRNNNLTTKKVFDLGESQDIQLVMTPHINGDDSISLAMEITLHKQSNPTMTTGRQRVQQSINTDLRITRPGQWKSTSIATSGEDTATVDSFPLTYRVEATAVEIPETTGTKKNAQPLEKGT
jgi:hypothetical protein